MVSSLNNKNNANILTTKDASGTTTFFQYCPDKSLDYPLFLSVQISDFENNLLDFLKSIKFVESKEEIVETRSREKNFKLIKIISPSINMSRQIRMVNESDRYGKESILPRSGHRIYRYKDVGLMIYSFAADRWELALSLSNSGGSVSGFDNEKLHGLKIIFTRILSWALSPLGVIGLWGVGVDEGIVVMNQQRAQYESVLIDYFKNKLTTIEETVDIKPAFKIIRLDPTLKGGRNFSMTPEALAGMLSAGTTYFDYDGPSLALRQVIRAISIRYEGVVHPQSSFRPRTDLSP